jgi:hypothetical protein
MHLLGVDCSLVSCDVSSEINFCYLRKTCIAEYAHKSEIIPTALPTSGFYDFNIDLSTSNRLGVALMG